MPSLTPLHETYCKWDRTPPSQADVLEGLAQLVSTSLSGVHELIQVVQTEVLRTTLGLSAQKAKQLQKHPQLQKFYQFSYVALQNMAVTFLRPIYVALLKNFQSYMTNL